MGKRTTDNRAKHTARFTREDIIARGSDQVTRLGFEAAWGRQSRVPAR